MSVSSELVQFELGLSIPLVLKQHPPDGEGVPHPKAESGGFPRTNGHIGRPKSPSATIDDQQLRSGPTEIIGLHTRTSDLPASA